MNSEDITRSSEIWVEDDGYIVDKNNIFKVQGLGLIMLELYKKTLEILDGVAILYPVFFYDRINVLMLKYRLN